LLETGSTQLIRNTAAQQLADVQKSHPEELFNLLTRVVPYLRSKSWDTRIAAAKALGGIVENAEKFDPNADDPPIKPESASQSNGFTPVKKEEEGAPLPEGDDLMQLETLDVASILKYGKAMAGSAGKEYDTMLANMDPAARLAHQKKSLTARLGLGGEYIEEDLVTETDIAVQGTVASTPGLPRLDTSMSRTSSFATPGANTAMSPFDATAQTPTGQSQLSQRQLNQMKRKNKHGHG
ncbi:TATA-binding protein-associated factor mot1, partial [Cryomyces antarcticus]